MPKADDIPATEISARLVLLRTWLGLTEPEMAHRLGMPIRSYQEWERPGRRKFRSKMPLMKVSEATGVSADWLARGTDHEGRPSTDPVAVNGVPMPRVMHPGGAIVD